MIKVIELVSSEAQVPLRITSRVFLSDSSPACSHSQNEEIQGTETVAKQGTNKEWEQKPLSALTNGSIDFLYRGAEVPNSKKTMASTQEADKAADPFLYFSSDKRRLEYLLGKELPQMPSDDTKPTERKTRISFELDPFFDLVTSSPELLGDRPLATRLLLIRRTMHR